MGNYVYTPEQPVVQTAYGALRGYTYGEVDHFLGVPYAFAPRYRMPQPLSPWEGVRDALRFGPICPQMRPFSSEKRNLGMNRPWLEDENCQVLNIWAPHSVAEEKHPVFVWMHGGGFFSGASMEYETFDGFNMAREGVVFVSLNHRLNLLGHLNLADYGPEFANSVNLGIADLAAGLKWIRENVAAFGGDPDNVTICGHSGGGGKVLSMFQLPEVSDCFTRGIVMSGCLDNGPETTDADSRTLANAMLEHLGITRETIAKIYTVPYGELVAAYRAVAPGLKAQGVNVGMSPVANDWFPGFPIDGDFQPCGKDKALMLSTTLGEFNFKVNIPEEQKAEISSMDKFRMLCDRFGAGTENLISLFQDAYPDHDLLDLMYLDADFRRPTYETALRHARASRERNTFVYLFASDMPCDGRVPPWHGADIPYAFRNTDKAPVCCEPGLGEQNAAALSGAYLSFLRCGDPNHPALPRWKPFTDAHRYTMIIDEYSACREAHDEKLIRAYKELCPPLNFSPEL